MMMSEMVGNVVEFSEQEDPAHPVLHLQYAKQEPESFRHDATVVPSEFKNIQSP